jgi:hypothetical protein
MVVCPIAVRLIIVVNHDPLPSLLLGLRYLKPSSPFAVFSVYLEVRQGYLFFSLFARHQRVRVVLLVAVCAAAPCEVSRSGAPLRPRDAPHSHRDVDAAVPGELCQASHRVASHRIASRWLEWSIVAFACRC